VVKTLLNDARQVWSWRTPGVMTESMAVARSNKADSDILRDYEQFQLIESLHYFPSCKTTMSRDVAVQITLDCGAGQTQLPLLSVLPNKAVASMQLIYS